MGNLERAVNIADLRRMGRARLPAVVFDYLDGAAEEEQTLRDNVARLPPLAIPSPPWRGGVGSSICPSP